MIKVSGLASNKPSKLDTGTSYLLSDYNTITDLIVVVVDTVSGWCRSENQWRRSWEDREARKWGGSKLSTPLPKMGGCRTEVGKFLFKNAKFVAENFYYGDIYGQNWNFSIPGIFDRKIATFCSAYFFSSRLRWWKAKYCDGVCVAADWLACSWRRSIWRLYVLDGRIPTSRHTTQMLQVQLCQSDHPDCSGHTHKTRVFISRCNAATVWVKSKFYQRHSDYLSFVVLTVQFKVINVLFSVASVFMLKV